MLFWSRIDLVFCDLFILICPLKSPQCTFRLEQRDEKWGWKYCMETERHAKRCSKTENTAPSYIWKISHGTELAIAPKFYAGRPTGWSATVHAYILTKFVGFPIVVACMHSCFRRHSRRQTNKQHASSIAQRSPSSRMGGGGPPIRITSLRTSGSMMARPDSSLARQKAKIAELVESANNSIKTFRKTPKRLSLEALHSLFSLLPLCFYSVHFFLFYFHADRRSRKEQEHASVWIRGRSSIRPLASRTDVVLTSCSLANDETHRGYLNVDWGCQCDVCGASENWNAWYLRACSSCEGWFCVIVTNNFIYFLSFLCLMFIETY